MGIKLPQAKSYCYSAPPPQRKARRSKVAQEGEGRPGGLFARAQAVLRRAEHLALSALHLPGHEK
jgi:hypothetical protein